jgi:hypothetical protein
MREAHLVPESDMSSEELVKRYRLSQAPDPPPLTPAKRQKRRERLLARMAHYVPSEKNRRIFEEVVVKHKSQSDVAFRERLSRQRIAKIVQRMRDWIAFWGGDDAAYAPDQRQRLANHVAAQELTEFQRQLEKAISEWVPTTERKKYRFNQNGHDAGSELIYQSHVRPTNLYRLLLATILARAKLAGAGLDDALGAVAAGGPNQAMVVRTEINVSPAAASSPPKEALHSDILSGSTCGEAGSDQAAASDQGEKS